MNLYIETENGQPINHPAFEENLLQAFGEIPEHWVMFERVKCPDIGVYEVYEGATYELDGDLYTDIHHIRKMTEEEKIAKQQEVISAWGDHFLSWMFNTDTCRFEAPVPYPQDDKQYYWDEPTVSWKEQIPVI